LKSGSLIYCEAGSEMRRLWISFAIELLFVVLKLQGQGSLQTPRFPSPAYFRRLIERLPSVELRPPQHLHDFVVNGRLELSLRSFLELVLANNTEVQLQRLSVEPTRNEITRTFSPFDPVINGSFQRTRANTPSDTALVGVNTLNELEQPFRLSYQQTLQNGGQYEISFETLRYTSNDVYTTYNPALTANFSIVFTQPLLRSRGTYINRLPTLIARSRYQASRLSVADQITRLLQGAEDAYWDVVEARDDLSVQQAALEMLGSSLKRYGRELELGELAFVDLYQPKQAYAAEELLVSNARSRLQQAEDALRRQISADLDSEVREMPIVLTETMLPASDDEMLDREALVDRALHRRPDLDAARQSLTIDDFQYDQSKNALLPDISLTSRYNSAGLGGNFIERSDLFSSDSSASQIIHVTPGGLGNALDQVFRSSFPTYSVGLNVRFPVRDRRGAADLADAAVNKRLDALRIRLFEQQVRQEVLEAVTRVEGSRSSVKLAQVSADFARKRLEAEQRKYELGATTIYFLLDAQNTFSQAQADLVSQSIKYRHNVVNLLRATGTLPENRGVSVE
jgi:outer membrane protein